MDETARAGARLRYRAERRGLRETEILLGGFFAARGAGMDAGAMAAFAALLDEPDPEIWCWVAGRQPAPEHIDAELVAALRTFRVDSR